MGAVFGKDDPLKKLLRENKRFINRAVRELDRERAAFEREEERMNVEIKQQAQLQQIQAARIIAKDLVRTRQYITKFIEMRNNLLGCALTLQTVKSHQAMAEAMSNTAKAMGKMNKTINIPTITKMIAEFERENAKTEMMQEVMGLMMLWAMAIRKIKKIALCHKWWMKLV